MPSTGPVTHSPAERSPEACADCARLHGCAACFEELVRRFQAPLLHFLLRRARSRHDAEDLLQETFLTAYRKLDQYRSEWRFNTWLFTIAHRLTVSAARVRGRPVTGTSALATAASGAGDPLDAAQVGERRASLWTAARAALSDDAFTAVWLSYVESMTADEIGRVLGRSANAVRILLHRARTALAKELVESEERHE